MLARLLININENAVKFIDVCQRVVYCLSRMTVEKYQEVTTKHMAWNKLALVNQIIDNLLALLKEESLVPKFDISVLAQTVKSF